MRQDSLHDPGLRRRLRPHLGAAALAWPLALSADNPAVTATEQGSAFRSNQERLGSATGADPPSAASCKC